MYDCVFKKIGDNVCFLPFSHYRYHKNGILVLFMHDVADILLEFTKCNVYMKKRNGRIYSIHEYVSNVGFVAFALVW